MCNRIYLQEKISHDEFRRRGIRRSVTDVFIAVVFARAGGVNMFQLLLHCV